MMGTEHAMYDRVQLMTTIAHCTSHESRPADECAPESLSSSSPNLCDSIAYAYAPTQPILNVMLGACYAKPTENVMECSHSHTENPLKPQRVHAPIAPSQQTAMDHHRHVMCRLNCRILQYYRHNTRTHTSYVSIGVYCRVEMETR